MGRRWNGLLRRTRPRPVPAGAAPPPAQAPPPRRPPVLPPTLLDPAAESQLGTEGWAVVDLLGPDDVAALLATWREHHPGPKATWESDFYTGSPEVKRAIHDRIGATFAPAIDEHFVDHRSILRNFVMNWPGPDGGLVLHQHSTVVDPAQHRSVIVWCALTETTVANGTLCVVPRSHSVQRGPRPEHTPSWHEPHEELLLAEHLRAVELAPGQALVFDNQLLHCSFPNRTDAARVTAVAVVVPRAAEPAYYETAGGDRVDVYRLDPEFFLDNAPGDLEWARPDGLQLVRSERWAPTTVRPAELLRHLQAGGGPQVGRPPAPAVPAPPGRTATGAAAPPVLTDPDAQAQLSEFGFAVLPEVPAAALEAARRCWDDTGRAPDDPARALNWTFHSGDAGHKRRVSDALRGGLWPALRPAFTGHEPYLSTFITKWPGPDGAFAPHQDPTLVDEREVVGVTVWLPLDDVGADNGMLCFVPGSHRFADGLRVADVDDFPYADHEAAIVERFGVGVELRAGQPIVFDNRVIHYSGINTTDRPRVVASFGLRPADGPSTLARRVEGGRIALHALPEDFFIDVLPAEQHLWEPSTTPLAVVAARRHRIDAERFAALCAAVPAPPGVVRSTGAAAAWLDPGAFCARCGSDRIDPADRIGRNNAQLLCDACRTAPVVPG